MNLSAAEKVIPLINLRASLTNVIEQLGEGEIMLRVRVISIPFERRLPTSLREDLKKACETVIRKKLQEIEQEIQSL